MTTRTPEEVHLTLLTANNVLYETTLLATPQAVTQNQSCVCPNCGTQWLWHRRDATHIPRFWMAYTYPCPACSNDLPHLLFGFIPNTRILGAGGAPLPDDLLANQFLVAYHTTFHHATPNMSNYTKGVTS